MVPLFPELLPYFRDAFEEAAEGTKYVVTRYRKQGLNLRTQLLRIIANAGLTPWPKLFQNLRATRETELAEDWPEHVVCAWIGNSRLVARQHYLQVTEDHFERAAKSAQNPAQLGGAAQNPAQYSAVPIGKEVEVTLDSESNNADLQKNTLQYETVRGGKSGRYRT